MAQALTGAVRKRPGRRCQRQNPRPRCLVMPTQVGIYAFL